MLERFDVDVAGAPLDRVDEETVDELHDRRIINLRLGSDVILVFLEDLDVLFLDVLQELTELLIRGLVLFLDQRAERVLPGDDREQVVPGDELEVLDEPQVGRIRHRHGQGPSLPLQRKHRVLKRHVRWNQLGDVGVDFEL